MSLIFDKAGAFVDKAAAILESEGDVVIGCEEPGGRTIEVLMVAHSSQPVIDACEPAPSWWIQ